jgi:hypothetical protein
MADNVPITAGSGTTIATDDVSTVHYQRVKLVDGTLDATTAIAAGNGTNGGALRVTVASDSTGQIALAAGTNTNEIVGDVAEDAAIAGNPVRIGGRASTAMPTAMSADGDIVSPWLSREGMAVVTFNRTRTAALIPTIDTAVYADLDRLGSVVTVSSAALRNGGSGMIVGALLEDDAGSNFSIEAWFFQVSPTMVNADNGVFDISDANIATAVPLGCIDFWSANTKSLSTTNRITPGTYLGGPCAMHYTCASGDSAIYMILRARGAYDAAATDDLTIWLELIRY